MVGSRRAGEGRSQGRRNSQARGWVASILGAPGHEMQLGPLVPHLPPLSPLHTDRLSGAAPSSLASNPLSVHCLYTCPIGCLPPGLGKPRTEIWVFIAFLKMRFLPEPAACGSPSQSQAGSEVPSPLQATRGQEGQGLSSKQGALRHRQQHFWHVERVRPPLPPSSGPLGRPRSRSCPPAQNGLGLVHAGKD